MKSTCWDTRTTDSIIESGEKDTEASIPNLKSFGPTKTELRAKEVGEFSVMLCGKMGWGRSVAHQLLPQYNTFVWRFSKFSTAVTLAFIGVST